MPKGPSGNTFSEMLSLVALGRGVLPVGEHTPQYHARPDIAFVPFHDAPPIERGAGLAGDQHTARVCGFVRAAADANPPTN